MKTKVSKRSFFNVLFFCCFGLTSFCQTTAGQKTSAVVEFQKQLNKEFKDKNESPLSSKERKEFISLDFFPIDTSFSVVAEFVRTPFETTFEMQTSTDRKPVYVKYGEVYFDLKGKEYKLNVYQSQELKKTNKYRDYLFLPFTDATNGNTSYSGGRYIDLKIPKSNKIKIDFNQAYNPYCAYSGNYSCPVPPGENELPIPIRAGVKAYDKH
ncbi:MAG: DUF1684 domain-containing protein [Salinimicrobium sp.]